MAGSAEHNNAGQRGSSAGELPLIRALQSGDERAFATLLDRYHRSLVRLASVYVGDQVVAEDAAQETWLAVFRGIGRFEGRSSLKTWIFRILINTAKTRAIREGRSVPFSALDDGDGDEGESAVDPDRFSPADLESAGHWSSPPRRWDRTPEEMALSSEVRARIDDAIAQLPSQQRQVITLRDIEGWPSDEVCNILALTESNQRVLLHRARSRVRAALERYMEQA